jgi:transposase
MGVIFTHGVGLEGTYLSALHQRLPTRRSKKRVIVAVAHSIVVSAFHLLARHESYPELGSNYIDEHRRGHLVDPLMRRIERLGYHVTLESVVAV